MADVPALVIPCITPRVDGMPLWVQACIWGSVLPQSWSFMLAARARGLASAWTQIHIQFEEEVAAVLGINPPRYSRLRWSQWRIRIERISSPRTVSRSRSSRTGTAGSRSYERPETTGLRWPPGLKSALEVQVFLADGELVALCDSYYPAGLAQGTAIAQDRKIRGGVHALIEDPAGPVRRRIARSVDDLTAGCPRPRRLRR